MAEEIRILDPSRTNDSIRKVFDGHWGYGYDTAVTVAMMLQKYIDSNPEVPLEHFNYNNSYVAAKLHSTLMNSSFRIPGITVGTVHVNGGAIVHS